MQVEFTVRLRAAAQDPEDPMSVAENVFGRLEAPHGPGDRQNGHLGYEGRRGALAVSELMAVSDRPEGDVVGEQESQRVLDLIESGAYHSSIGGHSGNPSIQDMVYLPLSQGNDLAQTPADFVQQQHS